MEKRAQIPCVIGIGRFPEHGKWRKRRKKLPRRLVVWPRLELQQGRRVPGLLEGELRLSGLGAARHVAADEADRALEMVHAGAVVEAVGAPERREPVAAGVGGGAPALAETVRLVAGGTDASEDLGTARGVAGEWRWRRRLDVYRLGL